MLGSAAIDLIQARIGNRTNTAYEATILLELQAAQIRLERGAELPWFLKTLGTLTTVANTRTLALTSLSPAFIRETDEGMFGTNGSGEVKEIFKVSYRLARTNWEDYYGTAAFPEAYDLQNNTLYFFPTPDAAYSIEFWYFGKADTITTSTENTWLAHYPELVIAEAMIPIARFLRDNQLVTLAMADVARETARMATDNVAREEANRSRTMNEAQ